MNRIIYRPVWLAALLLTLLIPVTAVAEEGAGAIMQDLDGAYHGLSEYTGQGKWTVVMLWASDCHICNQEAHQYVAFHEAHKDSDATVLGISLDGKQKLDEARAFVERHQVSFPNLIDDPAKVAQFYSAKTGQSFRGTPTFMVYDPQGRLRGAQVGAVPTRIIESFIEQENAAEPTVSQDG